jgi:FMN phosphatase YigB (HAD superfamily)
MTRILCTGPAAQEPTLEEAKAAKLAEIQNEKSRARDAGFFVGGVLFDSDSAARVAYLELAMRLQAEPTFSTAWKASDGVWVTMDAALFAQVYASGEAHIAACFAWQAAREVEVAAAQTVADVQAVSAVYGG